MGNDSSTSTHGRDEQAANAELIRQALATPGGHLSIGRYGCTLYYARGCTLSSYDPDRLKAACLAAGLPVIDTRAAPIQHVAALALSGPLVAVGEPPDPEPWHTLTKAPLAYVAALSRAAGAEVRNLPTDGTAITAPGGAAPPAALDRRRFRRNAALVEAAGCEMASPGEPGLPHPGLTLLARCRLERDALMAEARTHHDIYGDCPHTEALVRQAREQHRTAMRLHRLAAQARQPLP